MGIISACAVIACVAVGEVTVALGPLCVEPFAEGVAGRDSILVLSIVIAGLVSLGATFGGTLVFDYGFNVETAADSPVWHPSESDVFPGDDTT